VTGLCRDIIRIWVHRVSRTPQQIRSQPTRALPPSFQSPLAAFLKSHTYNFGNFLRRLASAFSDNSRKKILNLLIFFKIEFVRKTFFRYPQKIQHFPGVTVYTPSNILNQSHVVIMFQVVGLNSVHVVLMFQLVGLN